jgi:hypothetical protein
MWHHHLGIVRTDVSQERVAYIFRVERIRELVTANVPSSRILSNLKTDVRLSRRF